MKKKKRFNSSESAALDLCLALTLTRLVMLELEHGLSVQQIAEKHALQVSSVEDCIYIVEMLKKLNG